MSDVIAVLSDIHGNLEALEAVLRDVDRQRPDTIAVLGDTIGYGPNPNECLERVVEVADILLIGNHEKEVLYPSEDLTDDARESLDWTQEHLFEAWEGLADRVRTHGVAAEACKVVDSRTYVHAAPRDPVEQYIWPAHECQYLVFNDQIDQRLAEFLSQFSEDHGFFGHTHAPAVLTGYENHKMFDPYTQRRLEWNRRHSFVGPTTLYIIPEGSPKLEGLSGRKLAINPGSVGQPRFIGDPDASYALYTGDTVTFRRIEYERDVTQQKVAELPLDSETREWLIALLAKGK